MNLGRALAHLYPDAEPGVDYTVRMGEDGKPHLAEWNLPEPEPTAAEIEAAKLGAAKEQKIGELHARAIGDLGSLFTPDKGRDELDLLFAEHIIKLCTALQVTPDPRLAEVGRVGQKALAKKAQVEAATTPADLDLITWT